jgi:hypothetical protein
MATDEEEHEQENELDKLLETLVLGYILALVKASLKNNVSSSFYALSELNQARKVAGFEPVKLDMSKITADNIKATKEYEKLLRDKGGSIIVEDDVRVFKPWINDLRAETKAQLIEIFDKSKDEGWTSQRIKDELIKIEDFGKNVRARVGAFCETRTQQDVATRKLWKYGGLELTQWHTMEDSRVRPHHVERNHRVYKIDEAPSLGEPNCRCYLSPYITKDNWSPDYTKEEIGYQPNKIKIQDSITSKFK